MYIYIYIYRLNIQTYIGSTLNTEACTGDHAAEHCAGAEALTSEGSIQHGPNAWPPPSANMCMGDGSLLLKAGNSKQRCHQCANILGPTG